jgi:hypothetical protein
MKNYSSLPGLSSLLHISLISGSEINTHWKDSQEFEVHYNISQFNPQHLRTDYKAIHWIISKFHEDSVILHLEWICKQEPCTECANKKPHWRMCLHD